MKKQTLLKTMLLGLLALSGMSSAWGKVVHPTKLIQYRANNAIADATDWHSTDFPKDAQPVI